MAERFQGKYQFESITNDKYKFTTVNTEYIEKHLSSLCVAKATGVDTISARLLKLAAPVKAPSVTHLMNMSLQTGEVPTEFKRAKVTPIYEDGPDDEAGN